MNDVVNEYRLWSIIRGEPVRSYAEELRREAIPNGISGTITFNPDQVCSDNEAHRHPLHALESIGDAAVTDNQSAIRKHAHEYDLDRDLLTAMVYPQNAHGWHDRFDSSGKTHEPGNVDVEMWSGLSDSDPNVIKNDPDADIELAAMMPSRVQGRVADPIYDIWYDSLSADGGRDGHDGSASASSASPSLPLAASLRPVRRPILTVRPLSKSMLSLGRCSS